MPTALPILLAQKGVFMRIGYVRVSCEDQHTDRQEALMKELEVEKVFIDRASGKDTARPALQEMMSLNKSEI